MNIDIAALARQRGVKRKRVRLRPIKPTHVLETDLLAIYQQGQQIWSDLARKIADQFELPALTTDASGAELTWLVDQAARQADATLIYQTERLGRWVSRVGAWHGSKTISGVKSALGVEIEPFIRLTDVRGLLDDAVRANVALIRSVNSDNRSRIENIIYDGFANRRTKKYITDALADAMGITKRRARLIANDQAFKLGIALTAYRNRQMGISEYIWRHTPNEHPRPHHVLRNGNVYRWDQPPYDGFPGYAISCHCLAESVVIVWP